MPPVRGTQTLVDQIGWVLRRPQLIVLEVAWRWSFGVPFLWVLAWNIRKILHTVPLADAGFYRVDTQNPWIGAVQMAGVWEHYSPYAAALLHWLVPTAALVWVVISGLGRSLVLVKLEPGVRWRPFALMTLQAGWLALLGATCWSWLRAIQWVAATHISQDGNADLIGYSIWAIFLSLGFFSLWALVNWPLTVAPILMLLEERSPWSALRRSFTLGRAFTGKLVEISLVMGIVSLMLIVLAMVISAAPLPFSDQLGSDALHSILFGATVFYLVGHDTFQVVRLKSFVEFWRTFRGVPAR
ncbi:MAG: hypothetical protein KGJ51_02475 [Acidobacteriota bacterium]|nr:hypothetical protein [Acidobacteriota bacterium]